MTTQIWKVTPLSNIPSAADISQADIDRLHHFDHSDPFSVLGVHPFKGPDPHKSYLVARIWIKDAISVYLRIDPCSFTLEKTPAKRSDCSDFRQDGQWIHCLPRSQWLFQAAFEVNKSLEDLPWTFRHTLNVQYDKDPSPGKWHERVDSYLFSQLINKEDLEKFQSGSFWNVCDVMGSHKKKFDGYEGVQFAVWAPRAKNISVVGTFNGFDGRAHPMNQRREFGVWELFIPGIAKEGDKYEYRIRGETGEEKVKMDPYSQEMEKAPYHQSIVTDHFFGGKSKYQWGDDEWMKTRETKNWDEEPMAIYEVHLGSWKRGAFGKNDKEEVGGRRLNYREICDDLIRHVKHLNFTHVEFLPLTWHPYEPSWGYQCINFYAVHSILGSPDDLKYLIDSLHRNNIGVLLDIVPAHFAKDDYGLARYDGSYLYEYADYREREFATWGTCAFNFKRNEVRTYVLGSIYYLLSCYHFDGIRVDAVSAMLYKNFMRDEYLLNEYGELGNIESQKFLKEMNYVIHNNFKGVFTIAEESTDYPNITNDTHHHSLGFNAKWDLGWMNDTLHYLCSPPDIRGNVYEKLTFRGMYLNNEKWILPLSHDEVVSGKGSILDKCGYESTPIEEKFKLIKTLLCYQVTSPGKPLMFMGLEYAQKGEWRERNMLDWHDLDQGDPHKKHFQFVKDLLFLYQEEKALYELDGHGHDAFRWSLCTRPNDCVIAYLRCSKIKKHDVLVILNFSNKMYHNYHIYVPYGGNWTMLLNSDDWLYGGNMNGKGKGSEVWAYPLDYMSHDNQGHQFYLNIDIPNGSCLVLKSPKTSIPSQLQPLQ